MTDMTKKQRDARQREVLFAISDGIGNMLECLPVINTLEVYHPDIDNIDVLQVDKYCSNSLKLQQGIFPYQNFVTIQDIENRDKSYNGMFATGKANYFLHKNNELSDLRSSLWHDPDDQFLRNKRNWKRSEVDWRFDIAREQKIDEDNFIWKPPLNHNDVDITYDVVIADCFRHTDK